MKVLLATLTLALLIPVGLGGCGDDPAKPGSIVARWDLTPSNCDALHLSKIRASAYRGASTEPENSAEQPCADSGSLSISPVTPGSYRVVIEGLNQDPTPRATHAAEDTVSVGDGGEATTAEVRLTKKDARLAIEWSFADSRTCTANGVEDVIVEILDEGNQTIDIVTVPCDNEFTDPADGTKKSGVLFEAVDSEETLTFFLRGQDATQSTVRQGDCKNQVLLAGDEKTYLVNLCEALPCSPDCSILD